MVWRQSATSWRRPRSLASRRIRGRVARPRYQQGRQKPAIKPTASKDAVIIWCRAVVTVCRGEDERDCMQTASSRSEHDSE